MPTPVIATKNHLVFLPSSDGLAQHDYLVASVVSEIAPMAKALAMEVLVRPSVSLLADSGVT